MAMKYLKVFRRFFFLIISAFGKPFAVIVSNKKTNKPYLKYFSRFCRILNESNCLLKFDGEICTELGTRLIVNTAQKSTIWTLNNIESQQYPTWNLILSLWWYMWKSKIKFQNFVPRTPWPEMSWNFFADCDESRLFTLAIVLYQQL